MKWRDADVMSLGQGEGEIYAEKGSIIIVSQVTRTKGENRRVIL